MASANGLVTVLRFRGAMTGEFYFGPKTNRQYRVGRSKLIEVDPLDAPEMLAMKVRNEFVFEAVEPEGVDTAKTEAKTNAPAVTNPSTAPVDTDVSAAVGDVHDEVDDTAEVTDPPVKAVRGKKS